MVIRNLKRRSKQQRESGSIALHMLVLLGTVMLVFMGFAYDLGRLYLDRAEVKTIANAMALAAAQNLIGTQQSTENANTAARAAARLSDSKGNRYDYGSIAIGEQTLNLTSEVPEPTYFDNMSAATGVGDGAGGGQAGGTTARFARIEATVEAPLTFFGLLAVAQERKVPIIAAAVAGVSGPLCSACGVEPLAVAAVSTDDTIDFGLVKGTRYTFYFSCTGQPTPLPLGDAGTTLQYLLLNRYDTEASTFSQEDTQLFRNGNNGTPPNANLLKACITIGQPEQIWATASPRICAQVAPNPSVQQFLCGLNNRFDNALPDTACQAITDAATLAGGTPIDTDLLDVDVYSAYAGRGRRIITVSVVDTLSANSDMTILGFRQFLVIPNPGFAALTPSDGPGRFIGTYIGNPMPLKQGRFGSCGVTSGPGKVVLHQ